MLPTKVIVSSPELTILGWLTLTHRKINRSENNISGHRCSSQSASSLSSKERDLPVCALSRIQELISHNDLPRRPSHVFLLFLVLSIFMRVVAVVDMNRQACSDVGEREEALNPGSFCATFD